MYVKIEKKKIWLILHYFYIDFLCVHLTQPDDNLCTVKNVSLEENNFALSRRRLIHLSLCLLFD